VGRIELLKDELVEFGNYLVEVQDVQKIKGRFTHEPRAVTMEL
jgi:hypothetical protein